MSNSDDIKKLYFDKIDPEEESLINLDESINLKYEKLELLYNELIPKNIYEDAKMKSLDERTKLGVENDDNFVYGEMTFRTLSYIYETIKRIYGPNSIKDGNFYDLGSVKLF